MGILNEIDEEVLSQPAVGVIATQANEDAIVRIVTLARMRNYAVFVAYGSEEEPRAVELARELGAETVRPESGSTDEEAFRDVLATVARTRGFPGLLIHSSPEEFIDYEKSQKLFAEDSDYVVSAPTHQPSDDGSATVLVAIPAYNEGAVIGEIVESVRKYADNVLVIDDGSTDDTASIAAEAGAEVIRHDDNRGYGGALKTAFAEASERGVDHLLTFDGDGQHDPDDIPRIVEAQQETGAEMVIGSRFADGVQTDIPLYRRFGLMVVNLFTNVSLGVVRSESRVSDTQSGFRAYDASAIETLSEDASLGDHMSISTDILHHAHRHGYDIEEVGTVINYDVEEASSYNPVAHGYVLVMNLINTIEHTRPLMSLALPGFVLTFVGLGLGYWGFLSYADSGVIPLGRALVSAFFILMGQLTCFSGIILHSLNKYFEQAPQMGLERGARSR